MLHESLPTPTLHHDPDFLNISKRESDYITVSGEFGDLGKESKLEQYNLWMTDHPCLYREDTHNWIYPLQHALSPTRLWKLQATKIDHDQQTNTYMLQTTYRSTTCSIKSLDTNNPNVHPWEPDWITHIYSHNRVLCSYKKRMRNISLHCNVIIQEYMVN